MAATRMVAAGTPSQQASALVHLERRAEWRYVQINGTRYVVLPSGRSDRVYWVRADADGCSCLWYVRTGTSCAHMIAVRRANEQERRAAMRPLRTIPQAETAAAANATSYYQQLKAREKILRLMGWEKSEFSDDPTYSKLAEWVERAEQGGVGR